MANEAIWICWERQRRNRELAAALGVPLHELAHLDGMGSRPLKYLRGLAETAVVLLRTRPRRVFAMNPSVVLAAFCVTVGRVFPVQVVVDAHNSGLVPLEGRSRVLNALARHVMRHADLTVVTNEGLRPLVERHGGRVAVLPDRLPAMGRVARRACGAPATWSSSAPTPPTSPTARCWPRPVCCRTTGWCTSPATRPGPPWSRPTCRPTWS